MHLTKQVGVDNNENAWGVEGQFATAIVTGIGMTGGTLGRPVATANLTHLIL